MTTEPTDRDELANGWTKSSDLLPDTPDPATGEEGWLIASCIVAACAVLAMLFHVGLTMWGGA